MNAAAIWGPGYSQAELNEAQEKFAVSFPPDLVELWCERRLLAGYDLVRDEPRIRAMLVWPLEGILFDVENNDLWPDEWGERPGAEPARAEVVTGLVNAAPRLIPLYGHRFIPDAPSEEGNPVFSVMQSDIIYYGCNLSNYFENELGRHGAVSLCGPIKPIPFWSDFAEKWGPFTAR